MLFNRDVISYTKTVSVLLLLLCTNTGVFLGLYVVLAADRQ